jgi:hypothetical protein
MSITRRLRIVLVALAALLAVTGGAGVGASPAAAGDTFTTTAAAPTNMRKVGDDTYLDLTSTVAYAGTLSGTSTVRGDLIVHADGSANFYDIETFTGTVNGVSGVVTFYLSGSSSPANDYEGTAVIVYAAGALARLTGTLKQTGTVPGRVQGPGPLGTYTLGAPSAMPGLPNTGGGGARHGGGAGALLPVGLGLASTITLACRRTRGRRGN